MTAEIRVPRETVNDDVVKVVRWLAREGEVVRPGTPVVEIETSKTVLEVEPPCEGRLHILHAAAAEVPVGAVVTDAAGAVLAGNLPAHKARLELMLRLGNQVKWGEFPVH
jgi:pyruvate/2-oxoglutarate dehydrogenase complex dihydrolipoamide acyltransferase (E2) component